MAQCHTRYVGKKVAKKPYPSRQKAQQARAYLITRKGIDKHEISVYRCSKCRDWHIGRTTGLIAFKQYQTAKRKREELIAGVLTALALGRFKGDAVYLLRETKKHVDKLQAKCYNTYS